jgi:hypothetical protein
MRECARTRRTTGVDHTYETALAVLQIATLPADGTRATATKRISAHPVGQLGVRLYQTHGWRKTLCRLLIPRHYSRQAEEVSSAFGGGLDMRRRPVRTSGDRRHSRLARNAQKVKSSRRRCKYLTQSQAHRIDRLLKALGCLDRDKRGCDRKRLAIWFQNDESFSLAPLR